MQNGSDLTQQYAIQYLKHLIIKVLYGIGLGKIGNLKVMKFLRSQLLSLLNHHS